MDYVVKELVFKKELNFFTDSKISKIKIHDFIDIEVRIIQDTCYSTQYNIDFLSLNGYNCFKNDNNELCEHCCKCGFKSYEEAYDYANKKMKSILNNVISCIIADIYDHVDIIEIV